MPSDMRLDEASTTVDIGGIYCSKYSNDKVSDCVYTVLFLHAQADFNSVLTASNMYMRVITLA